MEAEFEDGVAGELEGGAEVGEGVVHVRGEGAGVLAQGTGTGALGAAGGREGLDDADGVGAGGGPRGDAGGGRVRGAGVGVVLALGRPLDRLVGDARPGDGEGRAGRDADEVEAEAGDDRAAAAMALLEDLLAGVAAVRLGVDEVLSRFELEPFVGAAVDLADEDGLRALVDDPDLDRRADGLRGVGEGLAEAPRLVAGAGGEVTEGAGDGEGGEMAAARVTGRW